MCSNIPRKFAQNYHDIQIQHFQQNNGLGLLQRRGKLFPPGHIVLINECKCGSGN